MEEFGVVRIRLSFGRNHERKFVFRSSWSSSTNLWQSFECIFSIRICNASENTISVLRVQSANWKMDKGPTFQLCTCSTPALHGSTIDGQLLRLFSHWFGWRVFWILVSNVVIKGSLNLVDWIEIIPWQRLFTVTQTNRFLSVHIRIAKVSIWYENAVQLFRGHGHTIFDSIKFDDRFKLLLYDWNCNAAGALSTDRWYQMQLGQHSTVAEG